MCDGLFTHSHRIQHNLCIHCSLSFLRASVICVHCPLILDIAVYKYTLSSIYLVNTSNICTCKMTSTSLLGKFSEGSSNSNSTTNGKPNILKTYAWMCFICISNFDRALVIFSPSLLRMRLYMCRAHLFTNLCEVFTGEIQTEF